MNLNKLAGGLTDLADGLTDLADGPFTRGQTRPQAERAVESSVRADAGAGIAKRWREIQGAHSWDGLLDPLDLDLRKSLISYGELAQATYDGFNTEQRSPHAGACMYGADELLERSGVENASYYKVTKFFYATSSLPLPAAFLLLPLAALKDVWSRESNFIGYVAVATDEGAAALGRRDIVVAWRGTIRPLEWARDLDVTPTSAAPVLGDAASRHPLALVHNGFMSLYTSSNAESKYNKLSARDQALEEVRRLVELYKDEETSITVTGHSLGAALATLNAVDMVAHGVNVPSSNPSKPPCPVTATVFACPHVGNIFFRTAYRSFAKENGLRSLHLINFGDIVPQVPLIQYVDVHVPLSMNTDNSPFLTTPLLPRWRHSLELYLHCLAGHQGSRGGFRLEVDRDIALLNKEFDLLKEEYPVPASWYQNQHKNMVKNDQGKWELRDFKHV